MDVDLNPIEMTDWQISLDFNDDKIGYSFPGNIQLTDSKNLSEYANILIEACESANKNNLIDFSVSINVPEKYCENGERKEIRYRVHREHPTMGELLIFRRAPDYIDSLHNLLPSYISKILMSKSLTEGGLIIVCGPNGSGKSTTMASIIADRLRKYSGVAFTLEDPVEMPLAGTHGEGVCYQTELGHDRTMSKALRGAMRFFPSGSPGILMVGEVRDALSAQQLITASANGLLVICTVHSYDVASGLERMVGLASGGDSDVWASSLASSLRMIVHQKIINKKLYPTFLCSPQAANPVQSIIREEKWHHIKNEMVKQERQVRTLGENPLELKSTKRTILKTKQ